MSWWSHIKSSVSHFFHRSGNRITGASIRSGGGIHIVKNKASKFVSYGKVTPRKSSVSHYYAVRRVRKGSSRSSKQAYRVAWQRAWNSYLNYEKQYIQKVYKKFPEIKLPRKAFIPGQKGYIPISKRRAYIQQQQMIRTKNIERALLPLKQYKQQLLAKKPK